MIPCDPLHDLGGHLKNLFAELKHLFPNSKTEVEEAIGYALAKRGDVLSIADFRKGVLKVKIIKPVIRVHKDRHDSKSGQIVYHICYNATYYMGPDTAKFSRYKGFKFLP